MASVCTRNDPPFMQNANQSVPSALARSPGVAVFAHSFESEQWFHLHAAELVRHEVRQRRFQSCIEISRDYRGLATTEHSLF